MADARPVGPDAGLSCAHALRELRAGVSVERVAASGSGCLTLVRVDPRQHGLRVLSGEARPLDRWLDDEGAVGGINASMYMPGGRSTGILRDAETVNRSADNPQMGAFLAFDPVDPADAPAVMVGRGCAGFDLEALRARYRGIVQNYRILDCEGHAVEWQDADLHSAAAVAMDREGRVVFVHSRPAWRMRDLSARLADPALGLTGAMYVEGGPEASLVVRGAEGAELAVREVGLLSPVYLDGSRAMLWAIPNVLAFGPR